MSDVQQTVIAIGFFVLFALPPLLSQFRLQTPANWKDITLIMLDGAAAFFAVVNALGGFGGDYVGLVSLLLAVVYIGFAGAALHRRATDALLVDTYVLAGIGLIALALFAQMEWEWVAAGWAPFSVLLLWLSLRLERHSIFNCAVGLLAGALGFLFLNLPMFHTNPEILWHPFTSHWALLSYVVFASILAWMFGSKAVPKSILPSAEFGERIQPGLHTLVAILLFLAITFEVTGLQWVVTLPVALSYLGFAVLSIVLFALTGMSVWLVAALLVQVLVFLFTFVVGGTSGLVSPLLQGPATMPFIHPWAAVSVFSLGLIAALLPVLARRPGHWANAKDFRGILIAVASVQIWLHVTVEIQHLQSALLWSNIVFQRVLSGWWIAFSIPYFVWGIRSQRPFILRAALLALGLPFLKDLFLISSAQGTMYEIALWTIIPLTVATVGAQLRIQDLLKAGSIMLAAAMAMDMIETVQSNSGLLRTIWWAIAGLVTMSIGFQQREQLLRRLAMGIFGATVVKLLFFDFAMLSPGVRIGASILTGLLLIGASYLYQRFDALLIKRS